MNTVPFEELVRALEIRTFSEFKKMNLYAPLDDSYIYFGPSWHFKRGLVTKGIVEDIKENGRTVLTVGSGPAFLERFLVDRLDVEKDNIYLSDKEEFCVEGFKDYVFDMYGEWPSFGQKFDYVLFPESVLNRKGLYHILRNSLDVTKPKGQIRIDGYGFDRGNFNEVRDKLLEEYGGLDFICSESLLVVNKN